MQAKAPQSAPATPDAKHRDDSTATTTPASTIGASTPGSGAAGLLKQLSIQEENESMGGRSMSQTQRNSAMSALWRKRKLESCPPEVHAKWARGETDSLLLEMKEDPTWGLTIARERVTLQNSLI